MGARAFCQTTLRNMEIEWCLKFATEVQPYADYGDLQNFHLAIKQVYGLPDCSLAPVCSSDEDSSLTRKKTYLLYGENTTGRY